MIQIGNSTAGRVEAPLWSYQLGLQNGWIPDDPRQAVGVCGALGTTSQPFNGSYASWQTGGAGAGTIAPSFVSLYSQFPFATMSNAAGAASLLPSYTPTGTVVTLSPPALTPSPSSMGNGWFDKSDTVGAFTSIQGCSYPDAWSAEGIAVPATCEGSSTASHAVAAAVVTPPSKIRKDAGIRG
jgi:glucan 1,3-beta-glucosidase